MEGGLIFVLVMLGLIFVIPSTFCVYAGCVFCWMSADERAELAARRDERFANRGDARRVGARARREMDLEAGIELQDRWGRPRVRSPPPAYVSPLPPAYVTGDALPPPPAYSVRPRGFEITIRAERVPRSVYVGAGSGM